jgi:hypothetical protein
VAEGGVSEALNVSLSAPEGSRGPVPGPRQGGVLVLIDSPFAYRGSRIIKTEMRRLLVSHESRHREEGDQDSENNPNVDVHREERLARYSFFLFN